MTKEKFNVIIPMAGESSRFGYRFKPFLNLDNRTFIEHVVGSFSKIDVEKYFFIIREEQERDNGVTDHLKNFLFPQLSEKIEVVQIKSKTKGPYQTILAGISQIGDVENAIICDSDHYVDISPMIESVTGPDPVDIAIPVWNISYREQQNWGKLIVSDIDGAICDVCEKEIVEESSGKTIYGILGCYYFSKTSILERDEDHVHFSDFLRSNHERYATIFCPINTAFFFGTPTMAERTVELRRRLETIFCDVDGVLIGHRSKSNDVDEDNLPIANGAEKIREWRNAGNKVILVTARPKRTRESFKKTLHRLGIEYDELVMGLNPGPRYLINDLKPTNMFVNQSVSVNLERDLGISEVILSESDNYDLEIVKTFRGNSFSKTFLVIDKEGCFVRKHIFKKEPTMEHCEKLKRQASDMKRFHYYDSSLVPKVLREKETAHDYCYDMEYLKGYTQLDEFSEKVRIEVLENLIDNLTQRVYCYRKKNNSTAFVDNFFETKIYPKLESYASECHVMDCLINDEKVKINGKEYYGIRAVLDNLGIHKFNTEYTSPIHGDLTLQNILYDGHQDYKLIDMDGSRYMDSCYFDLGKIFQSIVSKYDEWSVLPDVVFSKKLANMECVDKYFKCNPVDYRRICEKYLAATDQDNWERVFAKGIFYMSMYFIRFVPFRRQISNEHGIFAIMMSVNWLNYLYEELKL